MNNFNEWYFDLFSKGDGAGLNQQEIAEEAWYAQQTKIDELQKRIDEYNRKLNIFIDGLKKAHNDDKNNKIDYWRGFSECADSSVQVFIRDVGFID